MNGEGNAAGNNSGLLNQNGKTSQSAYGNNRLQENDRLIDQVDDTGSQHGSESDLDIGLTRKPNQRTKSLKAIEAEQDEFTKNFNNLQPNSKKYTSRRQKNYDDQDSEDADADPAQSNKDTGEIVYRDTMGNVTTIKPNMRFAYYKDIFTNLLKQASIVTKYPIVTMAISFDSTRAITVTKKDDKESYIKMYDLKNYELTFEEMIGGERDQYIKVKEVEQNPQGNYYAIVYNDDGRFFLRTFGKTTRSQTEIIQNELNINEMLGLDNYTMANQDFQDPFITCNFVGEDKVFVNFFHNHSKTHYHFIWDIKNRKMIGRKEEGVEGDLPITHVLDCSIKNFPYKSFYNPEKNQIYSFYRQGEAFIINDPSDPSNYKMEKMTDQPLGQMVLVYNEALIVRSSTKILFFKQEVDIETGEENWIQYHEINIRGFIYYIKGNIRIQVTSDAMIYFYLIDKDTLMPTLENVMYNYMGCNQMMFGSKVRYGISYKQNQKSFDVYTRKYMHNLKVCVQGENYAGSIALEIVTMNTFLVSKIDKVLMFDSDTFQQCGEIPIKLLPTETREPNEVIGMQKSKCEQFFAIISGKNLVKNEQKQNQLFIFKRVKAKNDHTYDTFEQTNRIVVKEIPFFNKVCMQYHFKNPPPGKDPDTLLFVKKEEIFEMNFETGQIKTLHKFKIEINRQPTLFQTNKSQQQFVIASTNDGIWYNHETQQEEDLDLMYSVDVIRNITYDDEDNKFYILTNKRKGYLGFYLIEFNDTKPSDFNFLTMWQHKLDLDDANIYILRGNEQGQQGKSFKELVISYKTCFINTYNVISTDLSGKVEKRATLFRHESFQLWESKISGLILIKNKDYVSFSKSGINVLALGSRHKRPLKDSEGQNKMIHSLDSLSFLKPESINFINYQCQDYNNRIISVEQEYQKGQETRYMEIYKVKIFEVTLRELLILQSFYICKTQSDIVHLVKSQPNPAFFYKSFLELDGANMVSILAFDSGSMEHLLGDNNQEYFNPLYPVIYRTKIQKKNNKSSYFYNTAIDNALKNNQVKAINFMIDYICKYQNNYVSSYLFRHNLPVMMEKGISINNLICNSSNIFKMPFDFDEWPSNHTDNSYQIRCYNSNFFDIRNHYKDVFVEEQFDPIEGKDIGNAPVYKIKYSINLLPIIGEHCQIIEDDEDEGLPNSTKIMHEGVSLTSLFQETEEVEIFDADCIQETIQYKWDTYGMRFHIFGFFMHCLYVLVVNIFVAVSYLEENKEGSGRIYVILLAIGILYPWIYDFTQMCRSGLADYLSDPWNYADMCYIYGSIANCVLQLIYGPFHPASRILMSVIILLLVVKTFFFLRIFGTLTPLVVMLTNVFGDLRPFMLFYTILIIMLGQLYAVIGLGNALHKRGMFNNYKPKFDDAAKEEDITKLDGVPGVEYYRVGLWIGEILWTLRISIGDNSAIGPASLLDGVENVLFWICFFVTVFASNIVFLNFIVAEASNTYAMVTETLEATIWMERSSLIAEAEEMTWKNYKTIEKFPRYLIVRDEEK